MVHARDVALIEEDLEDLRALFHAEGEGLDQADILNMCAAVNDLLTVLELDTVILIDNLKQVGYSPVLYGLVVQLLASQATSDGASGRLGNHQDTRLPDD